MQITQEKKVLMSRWEYSLLIVMIYYAGYSNGRTGWAKLWHNLSWETLILPAVLLLLSLPFVYWQYRRQHPRAGEPH